MSGRFSDQAYWRIRARVARALAETITDPAARHSMLDIAVNYEKIIMRAEAKAAPRSPGGRLTHDS